MAGRNIEIKARVSDPATVRKRVAALADRGPETLRQEDLFFPCRDGRLKLRSFGDGRGELIHYRRSDQCSPEECDYVVTPCGDPATLGELLKRTLGVRRVVRKDRTVYHNGRTRIHLDTVEGLGDFLELEYVLADGQSPEDGVRETHRLMEILGIVREDLVGPAYIDLLPARSG